jgi:intracellular multiplication protein IcmD
MKVKTQQSKKNGSWLKATLHFAIAAGCFYAAYAFGSDSDIGAAASKLTGTFSNLGSLVVGGAYLAGFGFVAAGIFKFKQAKDSHGQIPMSTPIAIVGVGAALIFLPSLIQIVSQSILNEPIYGGFSGEGAADVKST